MFLVSCGESHKDDVCFWYHVVKATKTMYVSDIMW